MHQLWVSMAGTAGVGKSTLTEQLGRTLPQGGFPAETFGEEELFTRPEFVHVAYGFRTKDYASPEQFEAAYGSWLATLAPGTTVVMDWNPAGMTGDLPWATTDRSRYRDHLAAVHALADGRVLLLNLRAPAEIAVERAGRQRGEDWLDRYDQIARSAGHHQPGRIARIVAATKLHLSRTEDEVALAAEAGWPIQTVDATRPPGVVHEFAIDIIDAAITVQPRIH